MRFQRLGYCIHIHLAVAKDDGICAAVTLGADQFAQNIALFSKCCIFAAGFYRNQRLLNRERGGRLAGHFDPEPLTIAGRDVEEVVDDIDELDAYFEQLDQKRSLTGRAAFESLSGMDEGGWI